MLIPPAGCTGFSPGLTNLSPARLGLGDVRVVKELPTTSTHSGHEVLDKNGESGFLESTGIHLDPNDEDFFIVTP